MKKTSWTKEEIDFVVENFRSMPYSKMASLLAKKESTLVGMTRRMGLERTREEQQLINQKFNTGRFTKGHRPANTGMKGRRVSVATEFKKGNLPAGTLFDGAITKRKDSNGYTYLWIRLGKAKWIPYHRHLWQEAYGPLPDGHIVVFKDGNTMNCEISNLELISRQEHRNRNYNKEKAHAALRKLWAEGKIDNGVISLNDNYVAGLLSKGDREMKEQIKENLPELIEIKRLSLQLNRTIKNERSRKTQ